MLPTKAARYKTQPDTSVCGNFLYTDELELSLLRREQHTVDIITDNIFISYF